MAPWSCDRCGRPRWREPAGWEGLCPRGQHDPRPRARRVPGVSTVSAAPASLAAVSRTRGAEGRGRAEGTGQAQCSWNWPECTGSGSGHPRGRRVQGQGAGGRKPAKARTCLPWKDSPFCTEEAERLLSHLWSSWLVVMAGRLCPGGRRHRPHWGIRAEKASSPRAPLRPVFSLQRGPASSDFSPRAGFPWLWLWGCLVGGALLSGQDREGRARPLGLELVPTPTCPRGGPQALFHPRSRDT